jgi:tetraacyldisaccharide 4'-kinase
MNPLSALFGVGVALRNTLFDKNILRASRLGKPVISVGNLSVGGSGKTPFVIALGELLANHGIRYDVLSRGYRRTTRGVRVVDRDGAPSEFGDEPLLIARRLRVPVIVGESRHEAGRVAEKQFNSALHILDDGFQHRSLVRDFDIVLLTAEDFQDRLLPAGRLRESLSSLERADAVVVAKDVVVQHPALTGKHLWRIRRELVIAGAPQNPVVFCGIARPKQFFEQLRQIGVNPVAEVVFRDHHPYSLADVERLRSLRRERGAEGFITTEKDAVNLGPLMAELKPFSAVVLRVIFESPADVVDTVLTRIAEQALRS